MPASLAVLAIVFLVPALLAAAVGLNLARARASRGWPAVPGRIVEAGTVVEDGLEIPRLSYEYTVGGRVLRGKRISFHEVQGGGFTRRTMERYPAGAAVEVRHHPRRPELAVLEPGARPINYVLVLVFLSLACAVLVFGAVRGIGG